MLKRGRGEKDTRKGGEAPHAHVKWDEEVIAEHDKSRGTRQKIDEPPTPYEYGSDDDDASSDREKNEGEGGNILMENWELVKAKLQYQNAVQSGEAVHGAVDERESIFRIDSELHEIQEGTEQMDEEEDKEMGQCIGELGAQSDNNIAYSKSEFKSKRAAHYNEFQLMKAMRDKGDDADSDSTSSN